MKNTEWQDTMVPENSGMGTESDRDDMPVSAKTGNARVLGGELVTMLKEGVASGDADRGLPEEVGRLVDSGAGLDELMAALRQAAERGRISPLMLVKAEKLMGAGPGADEMADRNQVLSRNRNKLAF